ncbi:MAG: hypothetical protein CL455_08335 [Acidimicrobiaceae bacterium]|nr:hypothetical protein [Acidimicrobiaceae bacterium]
MNSELNALTDSEVTRWWKSKYITVPLRIGLSVALLLVVIWSMDDIDWDELPDWNSETALWTIGAIVFTLTGFVLGAIRWQRVLIALDVRQPLRRLFSHYMAGQFVSNFLPTTVGGDVVRVGRLTRDTDDGPISFTSVVFERLSGWLVLPLITFIGFAINPGLTGLGKSTKIPLIVGFITLLGLGLVILLLGNARIGKGLRNRKGVLRYANAIHLGIDRLRDHPKAAREVVLSAFAYQFMLLLAAGCAVEALGIDQVGLTALMAFIPAVLIIQVLPLGIGGLGVREGTLVVFLSGLNVPSEQALALGLAIYAMTLIGSMIGFPLLIFGGRKGSNEEDPSIAET